MVLLEEKTEVKQDLPIRLKRLRRLPALRDLVRETELHLNDLVMPLFIKGMQGDKQPIHSMPGHFQIPLNRLREEIEELWELGIRSVILFGVPSHKDCTGSSAYQDDGIIQQAIREIKSIASDMLVIADVCFCEYTSHGHCGIITEIGGRKDIDNDATLEIVVKQSLSVVKAGADIVAPSGMVDGMVKAIRTGLDLAGFYYIPIMSYAIKYASSLYGPFRAAAEGAPSFGDRSSYYMDPANASEGLREAYLDIQEGADMLMVKPGHTYLDMIYRIKKAYPYMPLSAYHVSGEFAMIKAAAARGWINEKAVALEVLTSIRRAGADFIISYYTKEFAYWNKSK